MYAIIPQEILKADDITAQTKLLYGGILSQTSADKYCYATNEDFRKALNIQLVTVSKGIHDLEERGYIKREYSDKKRKIKPMVF